MRIAATTSTFIPLNELLKKELVRIADGRIGDTIAIQENWRKLVGEAIGRRARVLYLKGRVLHVAVNNSSWLCELGFLRDTLLARIREGHPGLNVAEIRFKLGE